MATITNFRLKIRHWFRKNKKIVFLGIVVFGIVFTINRYLMLHDDITIPETTYTPNISIMDSSSSVPSKVQNTVEKMIEEYVGYCNEGNYQKAFNMLSDDCKEYAFNNSVEDFMEHVLDKMLTPKTYSIQNYSNFNKYYIYEVKYIDDILATGLTNQTYKYTTEKMTFSKNKEGTFDMSVGNFINCEKINNVLENDYLKIDVIEKITRYSLEVYNVKFTNRTDSTVVIADNIESDEVRLVLPGEYRKMENINTNIILQPGGSEECNLIFTKFFDDGDISKSLLFNAVRVIENYKGANGTKEEQKAEIENAIAKFSVEVPLR